MRFVIPFLGKTKSKYLEAGIQDYRKRLSRYAGVETPTIKNKIHQNDSDEVVKLYEANLLLAKIESYKNNMTVALDPNGKLVSSEELATMIGKWRDAGVESSTFLIGGHLGLHESVLQAADSSISLSPMTFTHEMTRLILFEQLYRSCTINSGHKYHN